MTSHHKRKADFTLERNSIPVIVPVLAPRNNMSLIYGAVSHAWSWISNYLGGLITAAPTTYTTMTYASSEIVAGTHIQLSDARMDGANAVKRQKLSDPTRRSRSSPAAERYKKAGRGKLLFDGCNTEEERQKRTEEFFAPPEFSISRKSRYATIMTPPRSRDGEEKQERRSSEPFIHSNPPKELGSPESMSARSQSLLWQKTSVAHISRTHESPLWSTSDADEVFKAAPQMSLEDRMNKLLLEVEKEESESLTPSKAAVERRAKLFEEKKKNDREAAIRAAKEKRLSREFPTRPLVQRLSPEWESRVKSIIGMDPTSVITTTIGGTELRTPDFHKLLGTRSWLNDESINAWIEWVVDAGNKSAKAEAEARGEKPSTVPKFIAHNSFFFQNLEKKGASSTQGVMKRKKAPGVSLMEVDSVFVPICSSSHWTIGVVRPVARTIEYFDSMGGNIYGFETAMRNWLKFQLGDSYVEVEWQASRPDSARQNNGWDCGVFVCTNAFCVVRGLDTRCYRERDMTLQRYNIAAVLMNRGFNGDFEWAGDGL